MPNNNTTTSKKTLSIIFGAGAEVSYGLPLGGKFAFDIFKEAKEEDRESFRALIKNVNRSSNYANEFLPEKFYNLAISMFSSKQFESLINSSLENKKDKIIEFITNFDSNVDYLIKILNKKISPKTIDSSFIALNVQVGSVFYNNDLSLNNALNDSSNIFRSKYFSVFLELLKRNPGNANLQLFIRTIMELLAGSYGEKLQSELNNRLFSNTSGINIFDDINGIFNISYKDIGVSGLSHILKKQPTQINSSMSDLEIIYELIDMILEELFSLAIDYQSFVDDNFRYLYSPKTNWAKFCKISIFLHTVRRYLIEKQKISGGITDGYYHDLINVENFFDIKKVTTVNYTNLIKNIYGKNYDYLHGSVYEYLDPFHNKIVDEANLKNDSQIKVPLLFTQSGIKPITSVSMTKRFHETYDVFNKSDVICALGFGFNSDDGHINTIFRTILEDIQLNNSQKKLFIITYSNNSESFEKEEFRKRLRLSTSNNLEILKVNNDRKINGKLWYKELASIT